MFKNYLLISWRNMTKNRIYSIINIAGLGIGMAIALLIGLWIADEVSFDHYAADHSRLAKGMVIQYDGNGEMYNGTVIAAPMGKALRDKYAGLFTKTALVNDAGNLLYALGDKRLRASTIYAQQDLPTMWSFHLHGGSMDALKDPSTILISQTLATALFGTGDAINKTIRCNTDFQFKIGGVYEDLPVNTSFYGIKAILPWSHPTNSYFTNNTNWGDHNSNLYVELVPNVTADRASAAIRTLCTPFIKGWKEELMVYPIDRAYLYDHFKDGKPSGGRITFVWLFGIIGIFVLLLACINFMNLSTARSDRRAREVGIRKTIGSLKSQLVGQFLSESVLVALVAFILALVLVTASLPFFNQLSGKQMRLPYDNPLLWCAAIAFTVLTGLVAGSYPAFYLSGFRPVQVLKGAFRAGRHASLPRQILVVLQFTVSLTLIIGTVIVYRQILYARERPAGYQRDGLVTVDINTNDIANHYDAIRTELLNSGVVTNVAASSMKIDDFGSNNVVDWRGKRPDQASVFFFNVNVTRDFGQTVGWKIAQGRDFSRDYPGDSSAVLLNETGARVTGIKNVVGEKMSIFGKKYTVIGVVKDMVNLSPYDTARPAIFLGDGYTSVMTMRLKAGEPAHQALAGIETIFKKYNPTSPFAYQFTDDDYARRFETEQRIGDLASVFAGLAIFISCLGLFGLAAFMAEQRTKEIGIRKVLGAGTFTLWGLLSKDFLKLVALSLIIAIPLAWLGMSQWLQNYAYRTGIPWWIFAAASVAMLLITLLTVSVQSLRAAMMNPTKSLRSE
jgi:putative ABC transport system permease protein